MEMHQIRYFLAVSETLNFTRAAEDCHVAQPSLSRAVKKLEEELGGELFRRERNETHLTDLGRTMVPLLTQCYESAAAAKAQAAKYGNAEYAPLRIGLSRTIDIQLLTPMLAELARVYAGLELNFKRGSAEDMLGELRSGDIEFAVTADTGADWERFDCWPLFEENFSLVVAKDHPFARRKKIDLETAAQETFIARRYSETAGAMERALAERGLTLSHRHELASEADSIALVACGLGVAILPRSTHRPDGVRSIDLKDFELRRNVNAYAVAGRQRSTMALGLIKMVRAADWSALTG